MARFWGCAYVAFANILLVSIIYCASSHRYLGEALYLINLLFGASISYFRGNHFFASCGAAALSWWINVLYDVIKRSEPTIGSIYSRFCTLNSIVWPRKLTWVLAFSGHSMEVRSIWNHFATHLRRAVLRYVRRLLGSRLLICWGRHYVWNTTEERQMEYLRSSSSFLSWNFEH